MQIDIATLFPEMCDAVLQESILGRAQKSGAISVQCWNIRDYTLNKHKRVDDVPYGGGRGHGLVRALRRNRTAEHCSRRPLSLRSNFSWRRI